MEKRERTTATSEATNVTLRIQLLNAFERNKCFVLLFVWCVFLQGRFACIAKENAAPNDEKKRNRGLVE